MSIQSIERFAQDVRFAVRLLIKHRAFTAVAILTLALGIGANTAIFSVVQAVLLRPLSFEEPDRLVALWARMPASGLERGHFSMLDFEDVRDQNQVFEQVAAIRGGTATLTGRGQPLPLQVGQVQPGFFSALRVAPLLGRTFTDQDTIPGAPDVVLLGQDLWRTQFGADPDVVGQSILLGGRSHTVVGVMPAGFAFPPPATDAWTPLRLTVQGPARRKMHFLRAIARLRDGVTLDQAAANLSTLSTRLEKDYPESNSGLSYYPMPLHDSLVGSHRRPLVVLLAAVGCLLLIACANVANLLLARSLRREREMAVRAALGAGRRRLFTQMLTESVLLAIAGGVLGIVLARWGADGLVALLPEDVWLPGLDRLSFNGPVLAFTLAVSLVTGIAFGCVPALRASEASLHGQLREGGRGFDGAVHTRMRHVLVAAQIALTVVLLASAGLLLRSFRHLVTADTGFKATGVLTARLSLAGSRYTPEGSVQRLYDMLIARLNQLPGVESVGLVRTLPLTNDSWTTGMDVEGRPVRPDVPADEVGYQMVGADYFQTMDIPLLAGRLPGPTDRVGAPRVVLINESARRQFFPNEDPIGRRVRTGPDRTSAPYTIIGVVGDIRHANLQSGPRAELYELFEQAPPPTMFLLMKVAGDPLLVSPLLRTAVGEIDPDLPVLNLRSMTQVASASVAMPRLTTTLVAAVAALALILANVGIYGVMAYGVGQRRREIGTRIALGAETRDVVLMIVREGTLVAGAGLLAGLVAAYAVTRGLSTLLVGVSAADPVTYGTVAVLILGVTLAASAIPASRAARIDPLEALRMD